MGMKTRKTTVDIVGEDFHINGQVTHPNRTWKGMRIEGLLFNSRMVQGIFDDLNPETRERWNYPDRPWDAEYNTDRFIAAMPSWRDHGVLSFNINLQGGSPEGYSPRQPWHNSAFEADGSLREDYMGRLQRILDKADELGMVPQVGFFYFGQDHRLRDEAAVIAATDTATDWLLERGYTNLLIEVCNEADIRKYTMDIIKHGRIHELIHRIQTRSTGKLPTAAGRLLVGASMSGGTLPTEAMVAASDYQLIHGNSVKEPRRIREMVQQVRAMTSYNGEPIMFNEDDHYEFEKPDNNFLAATGEHASWGFFDWRRQDEDFSEGYQSVPTDWEISSDRKRAFFQMVREMTGY